MQRAAEKKRGKNHPKTLPIAHAAIKIMRIVIVCASQGEAANAIQPVTGDNPVITSKPMSLTPCLLPDPMTSSHWNDDYDDDFDINDDDFDDDFDEDFEDLPDDEFEDFGDLDDDVDDADADDAEVIDDDTGVDDDFDDFDDLATDEDTFVDSEDGDE